MSTTLIDASPQVRISELGRRVLGGGHITPAEGLWLFNLEHREDIFDLLAWANRIRERFKGNRIHLCSIVNIKAGGCPEDCRFCAQSAAYETSSPRHGLVEREAVLTAAAEAKANGVTALGLVAAWRGMDEGPALDQICRRLAGVKAERPGAARCLAGHDQEPEGGRPPRGGRLGVLQSQPGNLAPVLSAGLHHAYL